MAALFRPLLLTPARIVSQLLFRRGRAAQCAATYCVVDVGEHLRMNLRCVDRFVWAILVAIAMAGVLYSPPARAQTCSNDAQCPAQSWCSASQGKCVPKLANGTPLPVDPGHVNPTLTGLCTAQVGALVCLSAICNTNNNTCGPQVALLTIAPTASATTQVGQSYSQTNVASGGTPSYVYSLTSGTLPPGTRLNTSTGTVSGTPTTSGPFSYAIMVTDSGTQTATTSTISGTIASVTLTIVSTASAATQVGQSYSQTNVASGGTPSYVYSLASGTLPAGTTLNTSTGTVSGTPTTSGPFSYAITATDSGTQTATTSTISGTIASVTLTIVSTASSTTQVGQSYSQTNVASGGTPSYIYSLASGTLPPGPPHGVGPADHGWAVQLRHQGHRQRHADRDHVDRQRHHRTRGPDLLERRPVPSPIVVLGVAEQVCAEIGERNAFAGGPGARQSDADRLVHGTGWSACLPERHLQYEQQHMRPPGCPADDRPNGIGDHPGRAELFADQRRQRRHAVLRLFADLGHAASRHQAQHFHRHGVGYADHVRAVQLRHHGHRQRHPDRDHVDHQRYHRIRDPDHRVDRIGGHPGRAELFADQRRQRRHAVLRLFADFGHAACRHHAQHLHRHGVGHADHVRAVQLRHQGHRQRHPDRDHVDHQRHRRTRAPDNTADPL